MKEIHRILKPEGQICFLDWIAPEDMGPQRITYPSGEVCAKETLSSYRKLLTDVGFEDIQFNDLKKDFLVYVKALQTRLEAPDFQKQFDSGLVKILLDRNVNLENTLKDHKQIAVRVLARRSN